MRITTRTSAGGLTRDAAATTTFPSHSLQISRTEFFADAITNDKLFPVKVDGMAALATIAKAFPIHEEDHPLLLAHRLVAAVAVTRPAGNVCVAAAAKLPIVPRQEQKK